MRPEANGPAPEAAGAAVDPRLEQRRREVAREAGRGRRRRLLVVGGFVAAGLGVLVATWTPLLDVESVTVDGAVLTSAAAVREAAGVAPGDPLVWFDPQAAEAAVTELAWVHTATVERRWSGAVTISVVERRPVAALAAADGGWLVADEEGRVLTRADEEPGDVALIDGVRSSAAVGEALDDSVGGALRVAAAIPEVLAPGVARIRLVGAGVELDLREGGVVVLADPQDAAEKLAAAAAVLAAVPDGCVERLDVSLASAPALVRAAGC